MVRANFYAQSVTIDQLFFLASGIVLLSAAFIYYFYLRPKIIKRLTNEE
ncbi:MAG: hypothetical protein ACW98F_07505 [Candidatus Hodarchaeales archaeon]